MSGSAGRFKKSPIFYLLTPICSVVQVHRVLGVALDELLPGLHLLPHEDGKDLVGLLRVVQGDAAEGPPLRVHGGLPQLVVVHLAQALEAGDDHLGVGVVPPELGGDGVPLLLAEGQAGGLAPGDAR